MQSQVTNNLRQHDSLCVRQRFTRQTATESSTVVVPLLRGHDLVQRGHHNCDDDDDVDDHSMTIHCQQCPANTQTNNYKYFNSALLIHTQTTTNTSS